MRKTRDSAVAEKAVRPLARAAAALPVKSFMKHFRSEFEYHIENKRCLVAGPDSEPKWGRAGASAGPGSRPTAHASPNVEKAA